jgi:photosystem II stability/assembly factor-like uncharacterized protein
VSLRSFATVDGHDRTFVGARLLELDRYADCHLIASVVVVSTYAARPLRLGLARCFGWLMSGTWKEQDSLVGSWTSIAFGDRAHGIVVGLGTIATTSDGGEHWESRDPGTPVQLRSVAAAGPTDAWAVGDEGTILATHDGGRTFVPSNAVIDGQPVTTQLIGTCFLDSSHGWVVGADGLILVTTDGGLTFVRQPNGEPALHDLLDVDFVNLTHGFAVGTAGVVLKTTDGGETWKAQMSNSSAQLFAVDFVDASIGYAVGRDGTIVSTRNGGDDWKVEDAGTNSTILLDVAFVDSQRGWVVGTEDTILATTDGGANWEPQQDPVGDPAFDNLTGVEFINADTGFAIGSRLLLKYTSQTST